MREIIVARDVAELNRFAAEKFIDIAEGAIDQRGRFDVALSGGSTPKALFRLLASEPFRTRVDWDRVLFFFGDERNVPPDSEQSNFRMANEDLFQPLQIRPENIFRWKTEIGDAETVAASYAEVIRTKIQGDVPGFDLIFLGMGSDGHTASLFPHTSGLDEKGRIAIANPVPQLDTTRLTLTYPVINAARNAVFLVVGTDKSRILADVIDGNSDFHDLPSRGVQPTNGRLLWYVDAAAAKDLAA
ncbi:MAG: 6-phosphogluconolactonase [Pyrinomonadaceae bacterium]